MMKKKEEISFWGLGFLMLDINSYLFYESEMDSESQSNLRWIRSSREMDFDDEEEGIDLFLGVRVFDVGYK